MIQWETILPLRVYCDASWADLPDDRHSTSGCCIMFFGSCVFWVNRNQHLLARSSFEAELIALCSIFLDSESNFGFQSTLWTRFE